MTDEAITFEQVWQRIQRLQREFFRTHRGELFTYRIVDDCIVPSHSDLSIPKSDFELVLPMLPLRDPRKIAKYVTGYPYVAAIVGDERVAQGDW